MSDDATGGRTLRSVARRLLGPALGPLDAVRHELQLLRERQDRIEARLEQLGRTQDRLAAYQDRFTEEIRAEYGSLVDVGVGARAVVDELVEPGRPETAGLALRNELDHAVRASTDLVESKLTDLRRELRELRRDNRLTQAMTAKVLEGEVVEGEVVEGGVPEGGVPDGERTVPAAVAPVPTRAFTHDAPGFDLLYRSFEDRHRGEPEMILERQRTDYLELLTGLPQPELPVADLGCGRGELVELLASSGVPAVGVDSNLGQVVDGSSADFVQADLFDWLDRQADGSLRAVVSLHVVEHLPLELQVRLVFEARRVVVPGGLLVLETPNTLSLSVAASNFWVDPTHQRPVHPLFLEFLAEEAGFGQVETRLLHPVPAHFSGPDAIRPLLDELDSLLLGAGDLALVARR